jgi:hypothetical protein
MGPKADIAQHGSDVCFVPRAVIVATKNAIVA